MSDRTWSPQQQAIFDWFEMNAPFSDQHLIVRARAGTGKTTTILEAINRAPERSILLAAFNKRIADELQTRMTNPYAIAKTLHGVGLQCVTRYWERVRILERSGKGQLGRADTLTQAVCGDQFPDPLKRLVSKLHTKAREIHPLAQGPKELIPIAVRYDIEPDDQWEKAGYDVERLARYAFEAMILAAEKKPLAIDFADMIYLPIRNKWLVPMYDLGVVDEAQDMSYAQLLLFLGVCSGRMAVIGDDRQAIYAFRGADSGSIDRLKRELQAHELGLTTTYRCAQRIVALASTLVRDFQAAPTNPAGSIEHLSTYEKMIEAVEPGDFILSRKNAPLAAVAMALIRANKRCVVTGRDIGAGLIALLDALAKGPAAQSIPQLIAKIGVWRVKQVERALRNDDEDQAERVNDKADTLITLADGTVSVPELRRRLDSLFSDTHVPESVITCSSVHKAKGLEADRVFVLIDTMLPRLFPGREREREADPAAEREEENIRYVAYTRAKSTLVLVSNGKPTGTQDAPRLPLEVAIPAAPAPATPVEPVAPEPVDEVPS
jgi:DNA helicase-2/ATP-dependent DNA helicase PcrA